MPNRTISEIDCSVHCKFIVSFISAYWTIRPPSRGPKACIPYVLLVFMIIIVQKKGKGRGKKSFADLMTFHCHPNDCYITYNKIVYTLQRRGDAPLSLFKGTIPLVLPGPKTMNIVTTCIAKALHITLLPN